MTITHRSASFLLLLTLVIIGIGAIGYWWTIRDTTPTLMQEEVLVPSSTSVQVGDDQLFRTDGAMVLIHIFLNQYYDQEGTYPESLSELKRITGISPTFSVPLDEKGEPYQYYPIDGGQQYQLCKKTVNGVCPTITPRVTFNSVKELAGGGTGPYYGVTGMTSAESICVVITTGSSIPSWKGENLNKWSHCVGHSLNRDVEGMWSWQAPYFEAGVPPLSPGMYTIAVYDQMGIKNPRLLGSHQFEIVQ